MSIEEIKEKICDHYCRFPYDLPEDKLEEECKMCPLNELKAESEGKIIEKQKTGWYIAHGMFEDRFWCSCGFIKIMDRRMFDWKYCPVCGRTKMVEPQEREDKECKNIQKSN